MAKPGKTVSLRLDEQLWSVCRSIAQRRSQSFNEFVETTLQQAAENDRRESLRSAFRQLALADTDVEYASSAQTEVALDQLQKDA